MLDKSTAGQAYIKFGSGEDVRSLGSIALETPISRITFYVLGITTPFLLCLANIDRLSVYFNNTTDTIISPGVSVPIFRKQGYLQFFFSKEENAIAFLTKAEIRTLYR